MIQVKLAFMDDRQTKLLRDEMEKERRAARELAAAKAAVQELSPSHSTTPEMKAPDSE